jgi:hypothetical protein
MAKAGDGEVVTGAKDMVEFAAEGGAVEEIVVTAMSKEMRAMTPRARREHVEQQLAKRQELQERIGVLAAERDAYVAKEEERLAKSGKTDAFDAKVNEAIKQQAAEKGITY